MEDFWETLDRLVAASTVVIDRPGGRPHPRYPEAIYPLDYGYLKGTAGGDGDGIDLWRGSLPAPRLDAIFCTVDLHKKDAEIKLVLGCTPAEREAALAFHQSGNGAATVVLRP